MKDDDYFDAELAGVRQRSPHSLLLRLHRHYHALPRPFRILIGVVAAVALIWGLRFHIHEQNDFTLKHTPSRFGPLSQTQPQALWHPEHPIRHQNGSNIDDRYVYMRHLGAGREGSAALYVDVTDGEVVVVKSYTNIMRNDLPERLSDDFGHITSKWQPEIEATLYLGAWKSGNESAYVPLRDYFILLSDEADWHWTIVTRFIEGGTLENLATAMKIQERTPQKLDKIFRPSLEKVIENLGMLHSKGFCHDDVKPDNIFIANTTHWLLGDLGQVRHVDHPWHSTDRWVRESQWPDCTLNDLRRILKTYMTFLRESCGDTSDFELSFFDGPQAWSKFYWAWMRKPVHVSEMLRMSKAYDSAADPEWKSLGHATGSESACLRRSIDVELTSTRVHLGLQDYWPFKQC